MDVNSSAFGSRLLWVNSMPNYRTKGNNKTNERESHSFIHLLIRVLTELLLCAKQCTYVGI